MSNKRRILNRILLIFLIVYVAGGVLLMFFQRSFIYFPSVVVYQDMKEMIVEAKEAKLKIIVLNEGHDDAILYFGGNAEAVDAYQKDFSQYFNKRTVYLVNYRGYGGSTGNPSEKALYADALLVYDKLKTKHKNISVIGRSLGSGVATYVASKRDVKKLVLVTPFDSVEAIAKGQFPIYPIEFMLLDKYDSIDRVNAIKAQTLMLVAGKDTLVSNENSFRLYNAFRPSKVEIKIFHPFGHNDIQFDTNYYPTMEEFLDRNESVVRNISTEITVDFKELRGTLTESDILSQYDGIKLVCGDQESSLGDHYCYADIERFNSVEAKMVVFFFKNGTLKQIKIDLPHGTSHAKLVERYTKEFGKAQMVPKPQSGEQLIGWVIPNGEVVTSLQADPKQDMVMWIEKENDDASWILFFLGLGLLLLSVSFYGQWYWITKNFKQSRISEKLEQGVQLSILEIVGQYIWIGLTKGFLIIGVVLLVLGCILKII